MTTTIASAPSKQWIWTWSIWVGFGLFDATQTVGAMRSEGMHHAWFVLFLVTGAGWLPWALATPVVLALGRRFRPRGLSTVRAWLVHLVACACIAIATAGWSAWLEILFNPYADPGPAPKFLQLSGDKFYNGILASLVLYAGIIAIGYALDARDRLAFERTQTARLSEQLSQAQLNALRSQIEPHFLFNALNAIAGLVREGRNDAAIGTIARLSDFLRRTLEGSSRQEVPLHEEIAFVEKYLDIQKVRFADRLTLSIDVPASLRDATVPSLILQPLVENAVKHGIAKRARGGAIAIVASEREGKLVLSISNDGPPLSPEGERDKRGIGVANVRTRLASLYADTFGFDMHDLATGGVEVLVTLPLRGSPALV
jgi:two-component sensor histidine kinase